MAGTVRYRRRAIKLAVVAHIEDGYAARIPGFPGLLATGGTRKEALADLDDALSDWIALALKQGIGLPELRPQRSTSLQAILNKLWAMHRAEIVTFREIADYVGTKPQRVSEWVTQRTRTPTGEAAIKLLAFAANRTLHISRRPQLAERYRNAFEAACMKFPVEGKE